MNRIKHLLAGLGLALAGSAHAGVIYHWQTAATSANMASMAGYIELSDAAVQAGRVSYRARACDGWPCDLADTGSPVERFYFIVNGDLTSALDIDLLSGTGYNYEAPAFDADFTIRGGRLEQMSLFVNTLSSTLSMAGRNIDWFSSDADNCYWGCSGGRGTFEAEVPEPAAPWLLAAAGLAAALARRRATRPTYPQLSSCVKPFCGIY